MIKFDRYEDGRELGNVELPDGSFPLIAIGWLGDKKDFPVGNVPQEFIDRLTRLITYQGNTVTVYRGYFPCAFCGYNGMLTNVQPEMGGGILLVPGMNIVFICPDMILHYVSEHSYLPPQSFVDAVLSREDDDINAEYIFSRSSLVV